MNGLAFIASLVRSLAWPAAVAVVVLVLRRPIGTALSRGVRRLRAGPVEVEFDQELAEVREELRRSPELASSELPEPSASLRGELARLAEVSPRSAVLEAFSQIHARLAELLDSVGIENTERVSARTLAKVAHSRELISDETMAAVEGLAVLRNLAAHSPTDDIGADRARDYLAMADAVMYALRVKPGARAS